MYIFILRIKHLQSFFLKKDRSKAIYANCYKTMIPKMKSSQVDKLAKESENNVQTTRTFSDYE